MFDRRRIGAARGIECGNAVLTDDLVRRAWALHMTHGYGGRRVAKLLNTSPHAVRRVLERDAWKHVPRPTPDECRQLLAAEAELAAMGVR